MHIDTRRIKSICPYFFYLSLFRCFFCFNPIPDTSRPTFFKLQKKKIVFINPSYTQARCLGINSQLRFASVCLSVCLFLCLSVSLSLCFSVSLFLCLSVILSLCLSASLSFSPFLDVGLCFLLFLFCLSISLCLLFFLPTFFCFLQACLYLSLYVFSVVTLLISFLLRERALHSVPDLNKQNLRTGI
jgi:hypothetical protein